MFKSFVIVGIELSTTNIFWVKDRPIKSYEKAANQTKPAAALGAARAESLLVVKENKKLIEEFHKESSIQIKLNVSDVFEASVMIEGSSDVQNKMSAIYNDYDGADDIYEDSSDYEFVVTYDI